MSAKTHATLDDLYAVPENGKAETVDGELVLMSPTAGIPGRADGKIYRSLDDYERQVGGGYAFPDNVGFAVQVGERLSFSPDAAFYVGPLKGASFLKAHRSLQLRSAVYLITDRPRSERWQKNELIISRRELSSYGTSTYSVTCWWASTGPAIRSIRRYTTAAR